MKMQKLEVKISADFKPLINDFKTLNKELDKIRNPQNGDSKFNKVFYFFWGIVFGQLIMLGIYLIAS
jgi:hypothetical protein